MGLLGQADNRLSPSAKSGSAAVPTEAGGFAACCIILSCRGQNAPCRAIGIPTV
jgi:hypothetical protein